MSVEKIGANSLATHLSSAAVNSEVNSKTTPSYSYSTFEVFNVLFREVAYVAYESTRAGYIEALLRCKSRSARMEVAGELGRMKARWAVPYLIMAMKKDRFNQVRAKAAEALGKIGDGKAVPALATSLQKDRHRWVRYKAVEALGDIRETKEDTRAVDVLINVLKNTTMRSFAARSLGLLKVKRAVPALLEVLIRGDHIDHAAAWALRRIKDPRAIKKLIEACKIKPAIEVVKALAQFADRRAVRSQLFKVIQDEDAGDATRVIAANVLIKTGGKSSIRFLTKAALKEGSDKDFTKAIIKKLLKMEPDKTMRACVKALKSRYNWVRANAIRCLGIMKNPTVIPHLVSALEDKHRYVRKVAEFTLSDLEDKRAIPYLVALLENPVKPAEARAAAMDLLGDIGDRRIAYQLLIALRDNNPNVRSKAVEVLGILKEPRAAKPILAMLKRGDCVHNAVTALGNLKVEKAVDPIVAILRNPKRSLSLRLKAVKALSQISSSKATDTLIATLKDVDNDEDLRIRAAHALCQIGDAKAKAALADVLKDKEDYSYIRREIVEVLGKMKGIWSLRTLIGVVSDDKEDVFLKSMAWDALNAKSSSEMPNLFKLLEDNDPCKRVVAAYMFRRHQSPRVAMALVIPALLDRNDAVRQEAKKTFKKVLTRAVLKK